MSYPGNSLVVSYLSAVGVFYSPNQLGQLKIGILQSCGCVTTNRWWQNLDSNEMLGEKLDGIYQKMLHFDWTNLNKKQLYGR